MTAALCLSNRRTDDIKDLNAASQAAVASLQGRIVELEKLIQNLTASVNESNANALHFLENQGDIMHTLDNLVQLSMVRPAAAPPSC